MGGISSSIRGRAREWKVSRLGGWIGLDLQLQLLPPAGMLLAEHKNWLSRIQPLHAARGSNVQTATCRLHLSHTNDGQLIAGGIVLHVSVWWLAPIIQNPCSARCFAAARHDAIMDVFHCIARTRRRWRDSRGYASRLGTGRRS